MAVAETGYDQRVAPGGSTPLPTAGAGAFGGQVGAALTEVGDTEHAARLRAYQVERRATADRELADGTKRMVEWQAATEKAIVDKRTNAAAGAAGHVAQVEGFYTPETRDALLASVTEDSVRERLAAQFDAHAANSTTREYDWATGVASAKVATDTQETIETLANSVRTSDDPKAFQNALATMETLVGGLNNTDDATRTKLSKYGGEAIAAGMLNRLFDKGQPQAALALIDSGAMNSYLSPAQIDQLRNEGRIGVDRQRVVAEQQVAVAKRALTDEVATAKTLNAAGAVQDDATLARLADGLRAVGDNSGAIELDLMRKQNGMAKVARAMTPQQRDAHIGQLAAIARPTANQQVELEYYRKVKGSLDSQFTNDRHSFFAANGMPAPPVDFSTGQGVAERKAWAQKTGAPFLSPADTNALQESYRKGAQGRMAVAEALSRVGGNEAFRAAQTVAPQDGVLRHVIGLPAHYRALVFDGEAARKDNKALVPVKESGERFRQVASFALSQVGEFRGATADAAGNIYAALVARHASKDGSPIPFQPEAFDTAVHMALGGDLLGPNGAKRGGVGKWGASPVLLPVAMTQADFDARMGRGKWDGAMTGSAVWANGQPMTFGDVRRMTPVAVGDGRYAFRDPRGNFVATKAGRFEVDLRRVKP